MSDATTVETEAQAASNGPASAPTGIDERLAYRGVFAQLLVRPEIGGLIAASAIWVFFWAVSGTFGLAGGTASILDVTSAPLGIMAVAVAMLMIGGEFDLSSGAATGALGIMIALLVRDVTGDMGGAGLSLWIALPISLLIALGIGWFNGTLVNRTSLPSFIVTLGTFFILKGAKLGYAKLIVDQIQVGKLDDLEIAAAERGGDRGYAFFNRIFASEWIRNDHVWERRDTVYTIACLVGLALVAAAVYELHFKRRSSQNVVGLGVFVVGLAAAVAGVLYLHNTDGTGNDTTGGIILGVAMLASFVGLGMWRYETNSERGGFVPDRVVLQRWGIGIAALVLAVFFASVLDAYDDERIYFQFTEQGIRAILFVALSGAGAIFLLMAAARAKSVSDTTRAVALLLTAVAVAAMAFFIRSESVSPKFRGQAFVVMLVIAGLIACWAVTNWLFVERRQPDRSADRLGQTMVLVGMVLFAIGVAARLLYVTQAELDAEISRTVFSIRTVWFLVFTGVVSWILARTKFGSWTYAVGGNKQAARQVGVPATRTKVQLFMLVSLAAWLVGTLLAFRLNTIQASTGDGEEFEYIIAAVVGGTALTGGYGSTLGAGIGAFIMAMAIQGIPSARWNSDWRFVFLGGILLGAVIANNYIRSKAEAAR
ncbi:MAG: hypothetical protein AAGD35_19040 [Actinomycetota bacterium]